MLQLDVKRGVPPKFVVDAIRRHDAANRVIVITYTVITYTLDDLRRYHRPGGSGLRGGACAVE